MRGGHLLREQSVKIRFCRVDAVFCCKIDSKMTDMREGEKKTVRYPDETALYASHPLIERLSQHELYTMSTNMDKLLHAIQGSRGRPRNAL